ncbi:MAG: hypothetical protein ACYC0T_06010 [Ramlibacter sp.]
MQRHARATADDERSPASAPQRREVLVTVLAVVPVVIAAVLAAVMHAPQDGRAAAPRPAPVSTSVVRAPPLAPHGDRFAAPCAECGVVEAVVPLGRPAAEAGTAWQMRIRMVDGSMRTVEQRGALAAGSRVMPAGGSVRVLSSRPGQG